MSILNKISKLIKLSEKIDIVSQKSADLVTPEMLEVLNKDYQRILKSLDYHDHKKTKFGVLSSHVHHVNLSDELNIKTRHKTDITFQFPNELNAVFEESMLVTPPPSPVKTGMVTVPRSPVKTTGMAINSLPPSPSKLKSPSKLPTNSLFLESVSLGLAKSSEALEEKYLHEARSSEYLDKVVKLGETVKSLISELQKEVETNKSNMIGSFKTLMEQNNLPYVEAHATQLLGELFDIVHRDGGTFAKLAKTLSEGFAEKLHAQNYPTVLGEVKKQVKKLLTLPSTESSVNVYTEFKKVIQTELNLPYNEGFYDLCKSEYSEYIHDGDLDFHVEKFVKLFNDRLMALNILDVRNNVVKENASLFSALGKIDARSDSYFELTKESKQLGQHFIQTLYDSPERIEVLLHFQKVKELTIRTDQINKILSIGSELYNQELIFMQDGEQRTYIQSANNCQDFASLQLVSWDELSQNIKSIFAKRKNHALLKTLDQQQIEKILSSAKISYDKIASIFASLPSVVEQNTCISFFPIKFESLPSGKLEHVCLVTTSGALNKIDKSNKLNRKALMQFQEMVKSFSEKSKPLVIDGVSYTFAYHDEEKGAIDVLLQQLNKGFSGGKTPLLSVAPESELVLNDPFRGCAEKKFIDFVRSQLTNPLDSKKMTILGAANLRMPIIPSREHSAILSESLIRLYKTCLSFYTKNEKDIPELKKEKISELKEAFNQIAIKDHAYISSYSVKLGKRYNLAKEKLSNLIKRIDTKPGSQKIYEHCLENFQDLTMPADQKSKIKNKENAHYRNMTILYTECLKFLNARKLLLDTKASSEVLQQDIDKLRLFSEEWNVNAKQTIEVLKKVSMTSKTTDSFNKVLEAAVKGIKAGLQLIDKPGKAFYSTDKMIETYTNLQKEAQKAEQDQIIFASVIPISVSYSEAESTTLETNYIDCCCACIANKLPVLTWLTDLQVAKQEKLASFECEPCFDLGSYPMPTKRVLFSNFCFNSPVALSSNSTTLSPLVRSLNLSDYNEDLEQIPTALPSVQDASQSQTGAQPTRIARKLFD